MLDIEKVCGLNQKGAMSSVEATSQAPHVQVTYEGMCSSASRISSITSCTHGGRGPSETAAL